METEECRGCFISDIKESKYVVKDGMLRRRVTANFLYDIVSKEQAYSSSGDKLGIMETSRKQVRRLESKIHGEEPCSGFALRVIQIDYHFHLIECQHTNTQQEIYDMIDDLNGSGFGDFEEWSSSLPPYEGCITDKGWGSWNDKQLTNHYIEMKFPFEVCKIGHSRNVSKKSIKSFRNTTPVQYKKNLLSFIDKIKSDNNWSAEQLIEDAKVLYHYNISNMACYYMTSPQKILSNKFNRIKYAIDRLNFNINFKTKQL